MGYTGLAVQMLRLAARATLAVYPEKLQRNFSQSPKSALTALRPTLPHHLRCRYSRARVRDHSAGAPRHAGNPTRGKRFLGGRDLARSLGPAGRARPPRRCDDRLALKLNGLPNAPAYSTLNRGVAQIIRLAPHDLADDLFAQ